MRVTENTNYEVVRDSIKRSKGRMENLQHQSATTKKLNTPSDDPVGSAKVLEVRTDKVNNDQFVTNAKMAESFLENTDHVLGELAEVVVRAKEIALGQASGASSSDATRLGVAEEVTQLIQQAITAANTRVGDRYLFSGYRTNKPPVDSEGRYQGDRGQMMVEISRDVFLSMNLSGIEAFNTHPERSADAERLQQGAGSPNDTYVKNRAPASEGPGEPEAPEVAGPQNTNVFDELQNLRIGLLTGDLDAIRNTLGRLDEMHTRLVGMRAKVGSRIQGLENTTEAVARHNITNAQLSQSIEDADMAQVVSDLAKEETVFRSALSSSQKLIQPTLLEFLK